MSEGTTWSDRALARSLGTDDPAALAFAQASLADPEADAVLDVKLTAESDDIEYEWRTADDVINRILDTYGYGNQ
jgi:hypothetical protein